MSDINCLMKTESLDLLKTIKGKTMVGYLAPFEDRKENILSSFALLFADGSSIIIHTDYAVAKMFGEEETISQLKCADDNLANYEKYYKFKTRDITISDIEIVTDSISRICSSEATDKYRIVIDSGIILKGAEGNFTIALNSDYSDDDWICVSASGSIDELRPLENVKDSWGDGEDGVTVVVYRTSRSI